MAHSGQLDTKSLHAPWRQTWIFEHGAVPSTHALIASSTVAAVLLFHFMARLASPARRLAPRKEVLRGFG